MGTLLRVQLDYILGRQRTHCSNRPSTAHGPSPRRPSPSSSSSLYASSPQPPDLLQAGRRSPRAELDDSESRGTVLDLTLLSSAIDSGESYLEASAGRVPFDMSTNCATTRHENAATGARRGSTKANLRRAAMSAAATVTRSQLPMRSNAASAIDARHVQQGRAGDLTYATLLSTKVDPTAVYGVLGLHRSLRRVQSIYPLLCLCANISTEAQSLLQTSGIQTRDVVPIDPMRPGAFGKLQILRLLEFRRVLFLDVDTIVLRNIDHLFEVHCDFAFAPDVGVEVTASKMNLINVGVFVHTPNQKILNDIMAHQQEAVQQRKESLTTLVPVSEHFLQDYINANRETLHGKMSICDLDAMYNVKRQMFSQHPTLWNCMRRDVAVMQFGGRQKPWHVVWTPHQAKGDAKAGAPTPSTAHIHEGKPSASKPIRTADLGSSDANSPAASEHVRPSANPPKAEHSLVGSKLGTTAVGKPPAHESQSQPPTIAGHLSKGITSKPSAGANHLPSDAATSGQRHGGHRSPPSSPPHAPPSAQRHGGHRSQPSSPPHAPPQPEDSALSHGAPPASPRHAQQRHSAHASVDISPPMAPPLSLVEQSAEGSQGSQRRRLDTATKQAQPQPTSSDPLFGTWWALYEERKLHELPQAKVSGNTTEIKVEETRSCDNSRTCSSVSEICIHNYLAHGSFALSAADWNALPFMMLGLASALVWCTLLIGASVCPNRMVRKPAQSQHQPIASADMWLETQEAQERQEGPPSASPVISPATSPHGPQKDVEFK